MMSAGGIATPETAKRVPIRLVESGPAAGALAAARSARQVGPGPAALLRHGRHHRQGLRDRSRRAAPRPRVRGRARRPLQEGLRPPDPGAGRRADRDRRGRRLPGAGRRHRSAEGRPGQRGRRSGPRLLRPGGQRADRHRRRPPPRLPRRRLLPRRPHAARRGRGPPGDRDARGATDGPRASPRPPGASTGWSTRTWRPPRACTGSSAARTCAATRSSPSAARGRCTPGRSAASCGCRACSSPTARARSRPTGCWPRRSRSTSCGPRRSAWPRPTGSSSTGSSRRWRPRADASCGAPACPTREVTVRRSAEMRYFGQGHEVDVEVPTGILSPASLAPITSSFETAYRLLYSRTPMGVPLEALELARGRLRPPAGPDHHERRSSRCRHRADRQEAPGRVLPGGRRLRGDAGLRPLPAGPGRAASRARPSWRSESRPPSSDPARSISVDAHRNLVAEPASGEAR